MSAFGDPRHRPTPDFSGLPGRGRLLIAFSGGADSTALAHLLASAPRQRDILCVHIDHQLDPDSGARARQAAAIAAAIGLPFIVDRVNVASDDSPEAAARAARYAALQRRMRPQETMLMAHHADDQVETVLLRLLRGAGPTGLAGIPAQRRFGQGWLARPLLEWPRSSLQDYCRTHGLHWIEDPANQCQSADRNFLRHDILPRLRARWPGLDQSVRRSGRLARAASMEVQEEAQSLLDQALINHQVLDGAFLHNANPHQRSECLRHWCRNATGTTPPGKRFDNWLAQIERVRPDRVPELRWSDYILRFWSGHFWLDRQRAWPVFELEWRSDQILELPNDLGRLSLEGGTPFGRTLWVSSGRSGERIPSADAGHHHGVNEWMRRRGVPPWQRLSYPRVHDRDQLLAIGDLWLDRTFSLELEARGLTLCWRAIESRWQPLTANMDAS